MRMKSRNKRFGTFLDLGVFFCHDLCSAFYGRTKAVLFSGKVGQPFSKIISAFCLTWRNTRI